MTDEVLIAGFDEIPPDTTDRNLSQEILPRIPNVFKRWQTTEETPPEILPPELLDDPDTKVKLIFRGGGQSSSAVRGATYFWGYTGGSHDIVAYRVIKLESGWVDWGRRFDRGRTLDTQNGVPQGLNRHARVQVQLRFDDRPQRERIRVAHDWHWGIGGADDANDIMRYRVVG